jgi:multicomponent Na+:H+ antiporter subunit E
MGFLFTFLVLSGFWVLLSGQFDAFHLTLGALCCLFVSFFSHDLLFQKKHDLPFQEKPARAWLVTVFRFVLYLPWLFYQIFRANLHVAWLALHPRAGELIDPQIVRFRSRLESDVAKATLANSITLTPGTITVHIIDDQFVVHAIDEKAAGDLPGEFQSEMERRIARVFDEGR